MAYFSVFHAVFKRSLTKVLRRPVVLAFSLAQPLMWMVFFGFLFQRFSLGDGVSHYRDFLLPGICAMSLLFGASQAGVGQIRDLQTGMLARMLATAAPHSALLAGKNAADSLRLLLQTFVIGMVGFCVGARFSPSPAALAMSLIHAVFFVWGYASLSNWLALKTRSQETLGVFIQVVNMPVFFTSTALVPSRHMPDWLSAIAQGNPLSAVADALRFGLMGIGQPPPWQATVATGAAAALLFWVATRELGKARLP